MIFSVNFEQDTAKCDLCKVTAFYAVTIWSDMRKADSLLIDVHYACRKHVEVAIFCATASHVSVSLDRLE